MESFSSRVKKELSELGNLANKELVRAELEGYLLTSSSNTFITENKYNINRFSKLLNNIGQDDYAIRMQGRNFCITTKKKVKIDDVENDESTSRAIVRGTFMGAGSITNPQNVYHLEIVFGDQRSCEGIHKILENYGIEAKVLKRDKDYIIYMKDGENISKFLAFVGASKSVLEFESTRVIKEMRNNVNRIVNCETANLNKTISSSVKQIDDIKFIKAKRKFDKLSEKERELAELRMENPDLSLQELGNLINLSKSGVNHRMKGISKFAEQLRNHKFGMEKK